MRVVNYSQISLSRVATFRGSVKIQNLKEDRPNLLSIGTFVVVRTSIIRDIAMEIFLAMRSLLRYCRIDRFERNVFIKIFIVYPIVKIGWVFL